MNDFLSICKKNFCYAVTFSMFINILQLTFSIYMLQVYDRVLTSYNLSTLVVITIAAVVSLVALTFLEWIRSRLLIRIGIEFDKKLSFPVLDAELRSSSALQKISNEGEIRDVQTLRSFLGSNAVFAFFDIPWMPIYFTLIFILHPALGSVAVGGGLLVIGFGMLTQKIAQAKLKEANDINRRAAALLANATRNAATIKAMGMIGSIGIRWHVLNAKIISLQTRASRGVGLVHSISKSVRIGLQVLIYAVGAYLTVTHASTAGVMIAASIIMGRALAPLDQAMAAYKQSLEAWSAYKRIKTTVEGSAIREKMDLPAPRGEVTAEAVSFTIQNNLVLDDVSFRLKSGTALAIIGSSASGKSTLCRLLLGIWSPTGGKVRLDGADIAAWDSEKLGKYMGYLAQEVELFSGTVAENIARMGDVDAGDVVRAAQAAGVHELILKLPDGYDTSIGDFGRGLSGGQRQRIGLARALYGEPRVVILDEPNSNLDEEGEARLIQSIIKMKRAGTTVIAVTHKPSLLAVMDEILVLRKGKVELFGPRTFVLQKLPSLQNCRRRQAMPSQALTALSIRDRRKTNERAVG